MTSNLEDMVAHLDVAQHASLEPPEAELVIAEDILTRGPDKEFLRSAVRTKSYAELRRHFGCSSRTVRCRALENGFAQPCPPVSEEHVDNNGDEYVTYTSYGPEMADLTDEEIDSILHQILDSFPSFGREMARAQFRAYGLRVSKDRVHDATLRVVGPHPCSEDEGSHGACIVSQVPMPYGTMMAGMLICCSADCIAKA
ncbi:hypothetical protein M422DRAFT_48413 [Sphaerobolus stellatus SS14]|uniref:Uncharacterized protein n=1 Tax=Sphaerobolus stellatus (strain SS14) TaxID=990650 RepID=A0A0C9V536_SPHS4|nr:hypothetical protein M422DRAFT_48413 [Sphaerobolus stellatus SS14]